jgi:hypothetical protein
MKKTVLGVVWLVAFRFAAAADEPKTEEVKKKALDKALETLEDAYNNQGHQSRPKARCLPEV